MSKDMKTLDEIRRTVEYCQNPDVSEDTIDSKAIVEKCATLLSHISTLEERIAFLEKALQQSVGLTLMTYEEEKEMADMTSGRYVYTSPARLRWSLTGENDPSRVPELAEYLRTQGGKS